MNLQPKRFLGLALSGPRTPKTAFASIEYYPREKKVFLLDLHEKVEPDADKSADEFLLQMINDSYSQEALLGINVPVDAPPCIVCTRKSCPMPERCSVSEVKWMREFLRRQKRKEEVIPYTTRPVELFLRHSVIGHLPKGFQFEVDEAMGANRAPLLARLSFLKRHLKNVSTIEILPKLSLVALAVRHGLDRKTVENYRDIELGIHAREQIIEFFVKDVGIFIYERDARTFAQSLPAFDAFLCAYTALLYDLKSCEERPKGFPRSASWIAYPKMGD